jgi:UDP-GlcNAc3NAcA epimerase
MKKILTVIGARPQIIKAAAISRAIREHYPTQLEECIVHTGQHYDSNMSDIFFEEMGIPQPSYNLAVGSGQHGAQTARMIERLEDILLQEKPNAVLLYGDTNSTLAGAISAVKLHIPVVHVEAGLRSFNKHMPEEINRIMCDHASTLLFSPTKQGIENLKREGFSMDIADRPSADRPAVFHCGDIMLDNSLYFAERLKGDTSYLASLGLLGKPFVLATIHRDHNTDDDERLTSIFRALLHIAEKDQQTIVLPIHPRTKKKLEQSSHSDLRSLVNDHPFFQMISPASFLEMIALESQCTFIITDSGGVQKEAYFFKKPCVILRPQTEWVEIVEHGNALLADADYDRICAGYDTLRAKNDWQWLPLFGDGKAAEFICGKIVELID